MGSNQCAYQHDQPAQINPKKKDWYGRQCTVNQLVGFKIENIQSKTERPAVDYSATAEISAVYLGGIFILQPAEEAQLFIKTDSLDPIAITKTSVVVIT